MISGQHYATSEQIVIRVRDDRGRESFSDVLTVVPEGVRYAFTVPDTVVAGQAFSMSIKRIDIVTGQLVTSDDRNFTLRAYSGNAPRPDYALNPAGVLADTVGLDHRRHLRLHAPRATTGPRPSTCGSATAAASRPSAG